jgi:hypothetical protein
MATTLFKRDYMLRSLVNGTPGSTAAADYVGRPIGASNVDYMGRGVVVVPWEATTAYTTPKIVELTTGEVLELTTNGTTGEAAPAMPANRSAAVEDGTAAWRRLLG